MSIDNPSHSYIYSIPNNATSLHLPLPLPVWLELALSSLIPLPLPPRPTFELAEFYSHFTMRS